MNLVDVLVFATLAVAFTLALAVRWTEKNGE